MCIIQRFSEKQKQQRFILDTGKCAVGASKCEICRAAWQGGNSKERVITILKQIFFFYGKISIFFLRLLIWLNEVHE